ncbi:MAG: Ref family recombination enhancement nuclease [Rhodanobacter sp.]
MPEVHHLLSGNRRIGHQDTLPLCPHHHRAIGKGLGPSLANGSKPFHAEYGSDQELLAMTDRALGLKPR